MAQKWIQGFIPGTHIAANGQRYTFSIADCIELAESYNPALHEAPIVIGHPKGDDPAMGWVDSLRFNTATQRVEYVEKDLLPEFTEMLEKKMFKKRSLALYTKDDPANPTPGKYHLRHVGYLGAMPPAIKGLADRPAFQEKAASAAGITFEFSEFMDWDAMNIAGMFRRLREFLLEKFGRETADNIIPDYQVTDLQTSAAKPEPEGSCYHEPTSTKEASMKVEEVQALIDKSLERVTASFSEQLKGIADSMKGITASFSELQKGQQEAADATARREFTEFCTGLSTRILPAEVPTIVDQLMTLRQAAPIEFGEGDQKTTVTAVDDYKAKLKNRAETIQFGEFAISGRAADRQAEDNIDQLASKAREFQESEAAAGRNITMTAAVEHVRQDKGGKQ